MQKFSVLLGYASIDIHSHFDHGVSGDLYSRSDAGKWECHRIFLNNPQQKGLWQNEVCQSPFYYGFRFIGLIEMMQLQRPAFSTILITVAVKGFLGQSRRSVPT